MKAIIVDDEKLARQRLVNLLNKVKEIELIGECSNGKSAITIINNTSPDLIFLDINMKDFNGFQVLQKITITPKPLIIFVTAYNEYAIKAFEVEAFDFLLKPFKEKRFFKTIDKILKTSKNESDIIFEKRLLDLLNLQKNLLLSNEASQQIPVREGNKTILVENNKIQYVIASGYYSEIFVKEKKYVIRESLNNLIKIFNNQNFVRVHRSAIINLKYIREILHSNYSEIDVKMKDDKVIRISKSQKKEFLAKIRG